LNNVCTFTGCTFENVSPCEPQATIGYLCIREDDPFTEQGRGRCYKDNLLFTCLPPSTTGVWIFNDLCTTNCNYDACPAVPTIAGSPCSTLSQRCLGNGKVFVYVLDFKELYGSYLLSVIRPLQHHVLKCLPLPHLAR
jgi:hypothetical protein